MTAVFVLRNNKIYKITTVDKPSMISYIEEAFDSGYFYYKGATISFDLVDKCIILD